MWSYVFMVFLYVWFLRNCSPFILFYFSRFPGTEERCDGHCPSKNEDGEDLLLWSECICSFYLSFFYICWLRRVYFFNFRKRLLTHFLKSDRSNSVLEVHFHPKGIFTGSSDGPKLSAYRDREGYLSRDWRFLLLWTSSLVHLTKT